MEDNKLHGKVKIELYNANTQIKEVIKGENVFQNAVIAKGLRNLGTTNTSYLTNGTVRSRELWKEIVGGLLLFRDNIQEGSSYMSAGNKMTGNGSFEVTNNTTPNELGSYNSVESSQGYNTITQVYDFATQQANGQISCVSLTSRLGGYIGYGNPSGRCCSTKAISTDMDIMTANPLADVDGRPRACIGNMFYDFVYNSTAHTITVRKYRVPITQASVFSWIPTSVTIDVSSLDYSYFNNTLQTRCVTDGKIMLNKDGVSQIEVGGTHKYWLYDPSDDSIIEKTITNTSSHRIWCRYPGIAYGKFFCKGTAIDDWYVTSIFDVETSAHIGDYKTHSNMYSEMGVISAAEFPNGLVQMGRGQGYGGDSGSGRDWPLLIYDPVNDTLYPTNGGGADMYWSYCYDSDVDALGYQARYNYFYIPNPLYLATIYNLQSPVTKTAAQTMKVTYTLTEA